VLLGLWDGGQTGTPMDDRRWLAYMLATAYHETAQKIWPIEEYGKGAGRDYGAPDPETGEAYFGRGLVQLTWKSNYQKAGAALGLIEDRDLVWHPGLALDSLIAARVMFRGMAEGWFTGRRLGQYFDGDTDDPINARQIINGNDKDTLIAGYHELFLEALDEAWIEVVEPAPTAAPVATTVIVNVQADPGVEVQVQINGEPCRVQIAHFRLPGAQIAHKGRSLNKGK
jgi:hypothetical protein